MNHFSRYVLPKICFLALAFSSISCKKKSVDLLSEKISGHAKLVRTETFDTGINDSFHLTEWSFEIENLENIEKEIRKFGLKEKSGSILNFSQNHSKNWIDSKYYTKCDKSYSWIDLKKENYKSAWISIPNQILIIEVGNW